MQTSDVNRVEEVAALESVVPQLARLEAAMSAGKQAQVAALEGVVPELAELEVALASGRRARVAALEGVVPDLARLEVALASGRRARVAALEGVVPDLAGLERLLADARASKLRALRDFAADNPDLRRLEEMQAEAKAQRAAFNLFEMISLWWQEDPHSRTLTWLLNPDGNHGVSDYFLKNFLLASGSLSGVHTTGDWSKAESQREWYCVVDGGGGYLDILVVDQDNEFLCAIENKIFSPEGGRQLTHYRRGLEAEYPNFTRRYVFLSPRGMESQYADEREHWKPMSYAAILQLVEQTIENQRAAMGKDVRAFLRQYAATLRRRIVPESNEIAALARKIYLEHREAIDLIIQHKPDFEEETKELFRQAEEETKELFRQAIDREQNWVRDVESGKIVRFRSSDWDRFPSFRTGTGWGSPHSLMTFEIDFRPGYPKLILMLGPSSDDAIREYIHVRIRQYPALFNRYRRKLTSTWSGLNDHGEILQPNYLDNWDADEIRADIDSWMENFAENVFPAMNEVIVDCLREYEAERNGG